MSDAVQLHFERDSDLLFNLLRGVSWPLCDDLRVCIGNIWIGLNRKGVERDDAPHKQDKRSSQDEQRIG
jgi:hypothetical protein